MARILVVDDVHSTLMQFKGVLEKAGHKVFLAESVDEGFAVISERSLDLVITDMLMPDKDGIELITALCCLYPGLKFIAMSGGGTLPEDNYLSAADLTGAELVLRKPIDWDKLLIFLETSFPTDCQIEAVPVVSGQTSSV